MHHPKVPLYPAALVHRRGERGGTEWRNVIDGALLLGVAAGPVPAALELYQVDFNVLSIVVVAFVVGGFLIAARRGAGVAPEPEAGPPASAPGGGA